MNFKKKITSLFLSLVLTSTTLLTVNAETNVPQLQVHHIDVGQGDSTYIELPDGSDILIDAGRIGSGDTVVDYLNSQEKGMDIEYLIATHPDADHVGGMQSVFEKMNIKNFYYPKDAPHTTKTWEDVLKLSSQEGCNIMDSESGTTLNIGGAVLRFIHPSIDYSSTNEDSVVTFLDYKNAEFMFTGDIESKTEEDMIELGLVEDIDFMTIPHHGSKTSSTPSFISKADPEYAIASVGYNSYGHPVPEVLERYKAVGAKIYRTDILANIVIKTDGDNATINGSKVDIGSTTNDWETHWAKDSIRDFIEKGYVKGYPDGKFRPDNSISRSEFVTIFNKAFGLTTKSGKVFSDTKNHWAKDFIDIAVTNGVANGISETKFAPDDPITREQAAKMVANYKKIADTNYDKLNNFSDGYNVSSWAKAEVEGMIEKRYMSGYPDGTFKPQGRMTRAEAVFTLNNVIESK